MKIEDIKSASMKEVNDRLAAIADELDNAEDLDALEAEVKALRDRKAEITAKAAKKKSLYAQIAANPGVVETDGDEIDAESFDASSKEYRSAWLKKMATTKDGDMLLGELTKKEATAYTITSSNTGAVVPTITLNKIKELVVSSTPLLDDATEIGLTEGFRLVRHTGTEQGDAKETEEGVANDDEIDDFDSVPLSGFEIKKHANITRKMKFVSIEAFEDWLVGHLVNRVYVEKERLLLRRIDSEVYGMAAENVLTAQTYDGATIRKIMALIAAAGIKTVYANNSTIWNGIAGIEDEMGRPVFLPSAMEDPTVQGVMYGARVKQDENLADNVVYFGVPAEIMKNNFEELFIQRSTDAKSFVETVAAYSLFDGGLENPKAFVKATFTPSAG